MADGEKPLKIVSLETENVKRVVAVHIAPDGNLVVIGGQNGQGKTSVLDSIAYCLGGKALMCDEPLRKGAESGRVEIDLGEFIVERTFDESGGKLVVRSPKGGRYPSPQKMLDALVGPLSFDPIEFSRMDRNEQRDALQRVVGLDFAELDRERAGLFEERTIQNREVKRLEAQLAGMPHHRDAPAEPVVVAELLEELREAQAAARAADVAEEELRKLNLEVAGNLAAQLDVDQQIQALERKREELKAQGVELAAAVTGLRKGVETRRAAVPDTTPITDQIASAERLNRKIQENAAHDELAGELMVAREDADALTTKIDEIDARKKRELAEARFPVEGLSFDEKGVYLAGVPFDQASAAEQLRVSVAMGLAMNPRLKVLLIRDASLLDDRSLAMVAEMAQEADGQLWLERVGDGAECTVVIEDGHVREGRS